MSDLLDDMLAQVRYQSRMRVKTDVLGATRKYNTLKPKIGTLIHNDGSESKLVRLEGSVPMSYLGVTYHIPVELFVPEEYPGYPPKVYVRPTPDMEVAKGHQHVDSEGLVYLPYLHSWTAATANIADLCGHMSAAFSAQPPLYTKPARPSVALSSSSATATAAATAAAGSSSARGGYGGYSNIHYGAGPGGTPSYTPNVTSAIRGSGSGGSPTTLASAAVVMGPGAASTPSSASSGGYYASNALSSSSSYEYPSQQSRSKREQLVRELTTSLQSVISAVLTSATSELDKEMELQYELESVAGDSVAANLTRLKEQETLLKERIKFLSETKTMELDKWVKSIDPKAPSLMAPAAIFNGEEGENKEDDEEAAPDTAASPEPAEGEDVDAVVEPPVTERLVYFDEVSAQLVKLVAEYNAIDDTIYHLDHALANGNGMDMQLFLKETRKLARKQFLCKTHILKINHKIDAAAGAGTGGSA